MFKVFNLFSITSLQLLTHITSSLADVFEAYVGGLYRDQGLGVVSAWLRPLFRPYIDEAYAYIRDQHRLPPRDEVQNGQPLSPSAALIAPGPTHIRNDSGSSAGSMGMAGAAAGSLSSPPPSPPLAQSVNVNAPVGHLGLFNQRLQQAGNGIEWRFKGPFILPSRKRSSSHTWWLFLRQTRGTKVPGSPRCGLRRPW